MYIHPSVLPLSKRLWPGLPVAGAVALVTFLLSLSQGAYPGSSAALIAEAAGLAPASGVAHPLFSVIVREIAALDIGSLTVRLNLFSALCGTLCAMLLYTLAGRLVLYSACEDGGGGARNELTDDTDATALLQPEEETYNRGILKIAILSGVVAAFLLTFLAPTWSAASRLDSGLFALLLALASLYVFPLNDSSDLFWRQALSVFLFVLGLFESAVLLLLVPLFAGLLFNKFLLTDRRAAQVGVTAVAGGAAILLSVWACGVKTGALSAGVSMAPLVSLAHGLTFHHLAELRSFFPRSGWLFAVVQVGLPATFLLFGKQLIFKERRVNTLLALALTTLALVPVLLNLPVSPFFLFQPVGHLPVFSGAVAALATACAVASGLIFIRSENSLLETDLSNPMEEEVARRTQWLKGCAGGLLLILTLLVAAVPFCSFRAADARQGAYADQVAREMLKEMGGRTCLVSKGLLDHHLRIQANMQGKPLTLITFRSQPLPQDIKDVERFISSSPLFEGLNRQRLLNALSIGVARFVMEWFSADPKAGTHAMVFAVPDLWTACGFRAVPEGLAFGGLRAEETIDTTLLVEQNRAFVERTGPLLARQIPEYGQVAALRAVLRMNAGFAANELGVLLEEAGELEAAYSAYGRASALDPVNVSAAVNAYALTSQRGLHPESETMHKKRMKSALAAARLRTPRDFTWVLQNHGTIHQKELYQQQAATWSALGAKAVAAAKRRKAQSVSDREGVVALLDNAAFCRQAGDMMKAESLYLAALEQDASNHEALVGMCTLMIGKRQAHEAEIWLEKALEAGVAPPFLRFQNVSIALLKNETDRAFKLLESATKEVPTDVRFWTLMADVMLSRGDIQLVEHQLLPNMQKALKSNDHYLTHAIRGMALRSKGTAFYGEARMSLLKALSLNASLSDIWTALLELDWMIGNATFTESDARKLLGIEPDHALANYLMGAQLLACGSLQESEDFLRRSTEKKATSAACNDLAENLRLQKRLPEAEAFVKQALELEPGLPAALDTWACILCDSGRFEESARVAGEAVAAKPDHLAFQLTLLRSQVKLSKKGEVMKLASQLDLAKAVIPAELMKEVEALME